MDSPDLLTVFDRWRAAKPQHVVHTWLRSDGTVKDEYTLQALYAAAGAVASQLQGVDVAVLCYPPGLEFLVSFYGCLFAGAAAAPCYPPDPRNREARTARHFESIVEASGASVSIAQVSAESSWGFSGVSGGATGAVHLSVCAVSTAGVA